MTVQNALKLHQAGDITAALQLYEEALSQRELLTPSVVSTIAANAGSLYMNNGKYDMAAIKFEIAIAATPEKPESHYNYAIVLNSKLKDNDKALSHCIKAMKLDPNFYKAYHLMGNILQDMGRLKKAEEYFVKAERIAKALQYDNENHPLPNAASGIILENLWMFQKPQLNYSHEILIPQSHQEQLGVSSLTITCLSLRPLLFEVPSILNAAECDHIMSTAAPKLEISHVMGSKINTDAVEHSERSIQEPYRSSYNAWLPPDPILNSLQERIALLTSLPLQYISLKSEELQVVKYESGGEFKMHHDSSSFKPRLLTALVYLQDSINDGDTCPSGGETVFPFANTHSTDEAYDSSSWSVDDSLNYLSKISNEEQKRMGVAVHPSKGKAILFFNHVSDGSIDPLAVHSGSRVHVGEKWVANYWVDLDMNFLKETMISDH